MNGRRASLLLRLPAAARYTLDEDSPGGQASGMGPIGTRVQAPTRSQVPGAAGDGPHDVWTVRVPRPVQRIRYQSE